MKQKNLKVTQFYRRRETIGVFYNITKAHNESDTDEVWINYYMYLETESMSTWRMTERASGELKRALCCQ